MKHLLSINESVFNSRVDLVYSHHDGFGHVLKIYLKENRKEIGEIVFRNKSYLSKWGYDWINEFHIGIKRKWQGKGIFAEALYEMLKYHDNTPIWISDGRVINRDVFKAIDKLDRNIFEVERFVQEIKTDDGKSLGLASGNIITLK